MTCDEYANITHELRHVLVRDFSANATSITLLNALMAVRVGKQTNSIFPCCCFTWHMCQWHTHGRISDSSILSLLALLMTATSYLVYEFIFKISVRHLFKHIQVDVFTDIHPFVNNLFVVFFLTLFLG